jgi:transposase-like protein
MIVAEPTSLAEAIVYFSDPANCRGYLVTRRWPNGIVTCPTCGSENVKFQPKYNRWQCAIHHVRRQFTLKTGTVMEDSPLSLDKWLVAMWLIASNRNGVSSWELHRALGITQKTTWFLLHRIRLAMQDEKFAGSLGCDFDAHETYIGGKVQNFHKERKKRYREEDKPNAMLFPPLLRQIFKTQPESPFDGPEAARRFDVLVRNLLSVPHDEIIQRQAEYQQSRVMDPSRPGPKRKPRYK